MFGVREGKSGESREENRITCGELSVLRVVGKSQDSPLLAMSDPAGFQNYSDELFQ